MEKNKGKNRPLGSLNGSKGSIYVKRKRTREKRAIVVAPGFIARCMFSG